MSLFSFYSYYFIRSPRIFLMEKNENFDVSTHQLVLSLELEMAKKSMAVPIASMRYFKREYRFSYLYT